MARKQKPLPYKRGDRVVYLRLDQYGIFVTQGEVTATRSDEIVYVKTISPYGVAFKHSFGRTPGNFQENPSPLWRLRHLNNDNIKTLEKRAKQANKLFQAHKDTAALMERQVDREAWEWKYNEIDRRRSEIPNGWDYLNRVASRMGFKQPKK